VVTDNGGTHLAIASSAVGAAGAIAVTNNTTVLTSVANPATTLTFAAPVGGTNASLTIDGVPFSSASNTVSGAILGVTLNLASQTTGNPVTLTVGPDAGQMTSAISDFISAYNTVVSTINTQYVVDPTGSIPAPPLEADLSLRSVQSSVLADAAYAVGGNSGLVNLAAMGINMNNDGTLSMGLNAAGQSFAQVVAANPAAVRNFFQNDSATGFADNFKTDLFNLTSYTQGPLNVALKQNQAEQQDLTNTIKDFQDRLSAQKTQLTNTYNSVNSSLQSYPLLLQLVTETLGSMTSNSGSSTSSNSHPILTSGL
jgi:flagellar hook-associated protein 2